MFNLTDGINILTISTSFGFGWRIREDVVGDPTLQAGVGATCAPGEGPDGAARVALRGAHRRIPVE